MKWNADKRRPTGGYWRCAVRHRAQIAGYLRARRDRDPVFRFTGQLTERRRKALIRRQERKEQHG